MKIRQVLSIAAVLMLAGVAAAPVEAQERIGFGYSVLSNGDCPRQQRTITAEYDSTSDVQLVRGDIRSAPAGGDCRVDSFAYSVRVARYFAVGGVDATVEFSASEETLAAPYVLADEAGNVLLRGDGRALFGSNLPAGAAKTIVAATGVSRRLGVVRLGVLVNLAPIDWAYHAPGRTVRLTWDADYRGAYMEGAWDRGADSFGVVSTGYRHALGESRFDISAGVTYRWGLSAVDNGAPYLQHIAGSAFIRDGPPQDHSVVTAVTVGYRL